MARLTAVPRRDVAVDLGTGHTRLYARGRGVVLVEPSVVSYRRENGMIIAIGSRADDMLGRTPDDIATVRPLEHGTVADFELTLRMLRHFLGTTRTRWNFGGIRRAVTCVPSDASSVQRRAVMETLTRSGGREVHVLDEPMAAALGAGLPVMESAGHLVVDIGRGKTDTAVIAAGSMVTAATSPVGGQALDEAIRRHVRERYELAISERTAEALKAAVGVDRDADGVSVRGQDLSGGLPRAVHVGAQEIQEAFEGPLSGIVSTLRTALDRCPSELVLDIADRGVLLTGGGARLRGLDERMRRETGLPVYVDEEPSTAAARGCGRCVEDFGSFRPLFPHTARRGRAMR